MNRGDNPDAERRPLPHGLCGALDLNYIGMIGHSDDGATAAVHVDSHITAGINRYAGASTTRPLLLFGKRNIDPFHASTWAAVWINQRGPNLQLNLIGSTHATF